MLYFCFSSVPEWRNWQTRGTQNPVGFTPRVGSIPSSGTIKSMTYSQRREPHPDAGFLG